MHHKVSTFYNSKVHRQQIKENNTPSVLNVSFHYGYRKVRNIGKLISQAKCEVFRGVLLKGTDRCTADPGIQTSASLAATSTLLE